MQIQCKCHAPNYYECHALSAIDTSCLGYDLGQAISAARTRRFDSPARSWLRFTRWDVCLRSKLDVVTQSATFCGRACDGYMNNWAWARLARHHRSGHSDLAVRLELTATHRAVFASTPHPCGSFSRAVSLGRYLIGLTVFLLLGVGNQPRLFSRGSAWDRYLMRLGC